MSVLRGTRSRASVSFGNVVSTLEKRSDQRTARRIYQFNETESARCWYDGRLERKEHGVAFIGWHHRAPKETGGKQIFLVDGEAPIFLPYQPLPGLCNNSSPGISFNGAPSGYQELNCAKQRSGIELGIDWSSDFDFCSFFVGSRKFAGKSTRHSSTWKRLYLTAFIPGSSMVTRFSSASVIVDRIH